MEALVGISELVDREARCARSVVNRLQRDEVGRHVSLEFRDDQAAVLAEPEDVETVGVLAVL